METAPDRDLGILVIPLAALLEYADPTLDNPWGCGQIHQQDVLNEVGYSTMEDAPPEFNSRLYLSYEYNIQRIAYFVEQGWDSTEEDREPITIDIGLEGYTPEYLISDGNHRVAAAKIRGDRSIAVEIIGDVAKAEAMFLRGVHPDEYSRLGASTA